MTDLELCMRLTDQCADALHCDNLDNLMTLMIARDEVYMRLEPEDLVLFMEWSKQAREGL